MSGRVVEYWENGRNNPPPNGNRVLQPGSVSVPLGGYSAPLYELQTDCVTARGCLLAIDNECLRVVSVMLKLNYQAHIPAVLAFDAGAIGTDVFGDDRFREGRLASFDELSFRYSLNSPLTASGFNCHGQALHTNQGRPEVVALRTANSALPPSPGGSQLTAVY